MFSRSVAAALLLLTSSVCTGFEYCSDRSWLKFQDNCYHFSTSSNDKLSYYGADDYCRGLGGYLVSIHSKAENDFLIEATSKHYYGGRQWIGLNDVESRDKYRWSDGTKVDYLQLANKTEYFKESCFAFIKPGGGWRREHCELRHTAICKKSVRDTEPVTVPPITPVEPTGNCPSDWTKFGEKCYKSFGRQEEDRKKFREAKEACIALGENHDLVSIHNAEEQAFLTQNLTYVGVSAWIGFSQISSDEIGHELVFGWTDNSRVNYTYWAPGHPQRGTWKNCVALSYEGVNKGEWLGNYCDIHKKAYICQRPLSPDEPPKPPQPSTCDGNLANYRNDCYSIHYDFKTWSEANSTCVAKGGHLVSVADSFEQAFLHNYVKMTSVWIGLRTISDTRIFGWSDKQPFYYSNWDDGQPSLTDLTTSQCVYMQTSSERTWRVKSCQDKSPFVCKYSKDGHRPVNPRNIIGKCPSQESSWVDIGDAYCYHIGQEKNARTQWGTLSRYCLSKGMDMIALHTEHQAKSLMTYVWKKPYDYWLGLIRTFDRSSFMWSDNSPMNYTNWDDREPSSWSSDKDCAGFSTRNSKWSVKDCSDWNGSICRAKKL